MATKKADVRESLIQQLKAKGADISVFTDQVDDYIKLWEIKEMLAKDIKSRGVVYEDVSAVGVKMKKNNPSVKEIVGVNRQMLAILDKLSITPALTKPTDDESDEL